MGSVEYHLVDGWKRLEVTRKNGIYAGKADIYVYSPDGSKFRSKKELHNYIVANGLPYKVEELFTATDAFGSNSGKGADKGKKGGPPERPQRGSASERPQRGSASERPHRASGSERSRRASASEKHPVPDSTTTQRRPLPPATESASSHSATTVSQSATATSPQSERSTSPESSIPDSSTDVITTAHQGTSNVLKESILSSSTDSDKEAPVDMSPFVQTSHGNPSFVPKNLNSMEAEAEGPTPQRPLLPYMLYSRRVWDLVKAEYPNLRLWEIGRIISNQWRMLPNILKREFVDEYKANKLLYENEMKEYLKSSANREGKREKSSSALPGTDETVNSILRKGSETAVRKIGIEAAENAEETVDAYPARAMAYSRYLRNHQLMCQIFNETVVPNKDTGVSDLQVDMLRNQVSSLKTHRNKMLSEIRQTKENYNKNKMKMNYKNMCFEEEMKMFSQVNEAKFESMVEEQYEILKTELMNYNPKSNPDKPELTFNPEMYNYLESHLEKFERNKEGQDDPVAAAAAIASVLIVSGAENVSPEIPYDASVHFRTGPNAESSYYKYAHLPCAERGNYPTDPIDALGPVPEYPCQREHYFRRLAELRKRQADGSGDVRYSPYQRERHTNLRYNLGCGSVASTRMLAAQRPVPGQHPAVQKWMQNNPRFPDDKQWSVLKWERK